MLMDDVLPPFLHSYGALKDHLDAELADLQSKEKGDTFVRFVKALIPLSDIGPRFEEADVRQHSHDGGVDLQAQSHDGLQSLFVQSRYSVRGVDDVDSILSGFQNFEATNFRPKAHVQASLFQAGTSIDSPTNTVSPRAPQFMVVTLSSITERILPRYEQSSKSSKPFFERLQAEGRITILDGDAILPLLRAAYRKLHVLPSDVELHFDCPLLVKNNVYVGIISADELRRCYAQYGDALFLENLRGFLQSIPKPN